MIRLVFAAFCFSLFSLLARYFEGIPPPVLLFWMYASGFVSIFFYALISRKLQKIFQNSKWFVIFAFSNAMASILYFWASVHVELAVLGLMVNTAPFWVLLLTTATKEESLTLSKSLHLLIALAAVVLIIGPLNLFGGEWSWFLLVALFSGFFYGCVFYFSRKIQKVQESTFSMLFFAYLIGMIFFIPWIYLSPLPFQISQIPALVFFAFLLVIGNISFFSAFRDVPAQESSTITLIEVAFIVLWGFLFYQEVPTWLAIFGGVILLSNSFWMARRVEEPKPV